MNKWKISSWILSVGGLAVLAYATHGWLVPTGVAAFVLGEWIDDQVRKWDE